MIALRIRDSRDIRTVEQIQRDAALLQEAADIRLEAVWRTRVAENVRRRNASKVRP